MVLVLALIELITLTLSLAEDPRIIFVQSYIRHGQNYPEASLDKQINQFYIRSNIPLSQLTNQGKAVSYLMGKKMYNIYWKKLFGDTANENFLTSQKILAKATNTSQTILSIEAHLFGLLEQLPPVQISQEQAKLVMPPYPGIQAKAGYVFGANGIGYHTVPINTQTLCQFGSYTTRQPLYQQNLKTSLSKKIQNYPPFKAAIDQFEIFLNLSSGTINMHNFHKYYMNQICQMFLGKKSIIRQATPEIRGALRSLHNIVIHLTLYTNQLQVRIDATPWFSQLIANIKNYIKNRNASQWVMFGCNGIPMGMILAALKMSSAQCIFDNYLKNIKNPEDCLTEFPPFGTVLAFEVYEYSNGSHTFKVNYNGRYLQIPICGNNKQCELIKLQEWFNNWKVGQQYQGCNGTNQYIVMAIKSGISPPLQLKVKNSLHQLNIQLSLLFCALIILFISFQTN